MSGGRLEVIKKRGKYILEIKKGYFLYNTKFKNGRAFLANGKIYNITRKTHPKMVKSILNNGEKCP